MVTGSSLDFEYKKHIHNFKGNELMPIRDFVFALCVVRKKDDAYEIENFLGTGFLIGNQGFGLTAAHVLSVDPTKEIMAMFVINGKWCGFKVKNSESHSHADVALIKLDGGPKRSPFRCRNQWEGSSRSYQQWGYPATVVWEQEPSEHGKVIPNLELIYFEGYVRRRFSHGLSIPNVKGTEFFEVSEQAGRGCSGSPLYVLGTDRAWEVIGIYVADVTINDENEGGSEMAVAYAAREDAFRDWRPILLGGRSILEESKLIDLTVN